MRTRTIGLIARIFIMAMFVAVVQMVATVASLASPQKGKGLPRGYKTDSGRLRAAKAILGDSLSPGESAAILKAHKVGAGQLGKDGTPARIGNYTSGQLRAKTEILSKAGINQTNRRKLIERGIVGDTAIHDLNYYPDNYYYIPPGGAPGYGVNMASGLINPSSNPGHREVNDGRSGAPDIGNFAIPLQNQGYEALMAHYHAAAARLNAPPRAFNNTLVSPGTYEMKHTYITEGPYYGRRTHTDTYHAEFRNGAQGLEVRIPEANLNWTPIPAPEAITTSSGKANRYVLNPAAAPYSRISLMSDAGADGFTVQIGTSAMRVTLAK